ncbi:MAG TPA: hypothetical protein VE621_14975, partial [Bryobacteraceae bacterium]|nr:hypothetical protein [Bryobacteraceae bacterium]
MSESPNAVILDGRIPVRRPAIVAVGSGGLVVSYLDHTELWPFGEIRQLAPNFKEEVLRLERNGAVLIILDTGVRDALRHAAPHLAASTRDPAVVLLIGGAVLALVFVVAI